MRYCSHASTRVLAPLHRCRFLVLCWVLLAPATLLAASGPETYGAGGVVASRSALASAVGARILEAGGNAIDATVATGFALAVTHPSAGNLGGGGFLVIRLADGTTITNDHRERAPRGASRDMFLGEDGQALPELSRESHLASGVPGTVDGLLAALDRFGTMSLAEVIQPAIELAEQGFELPRDLAKALERRLPQFAAYPASKAQFSRDGEPYAEGDRFTQPDLAASLKRIRDQGRAGFYAGKTAELIEAEMTRGGGLITRQDLAEYRSVWREPIIGTYRDHQIISMPPPSSGGVLLVQMLNMLEAEPLADLGFGSAATVHRMIEAERRAYADRAEHLGDPDYFPVPIEWLTSKDYARERFSTFDPDKATPSEMIEAGSWPEESPETTHASVMDAAGNAVSYTTTLNRSYGSKIVVAGAGFLLNNEMDDFSSKPNTPNTYGLLGREANAIAPGKRMLSSMTPTIVVKDGEPLLVTGSPGGSTIITTTLQVVLNVIDHGMDLSDAVGKPRFHHQWFPDRVIYEPYGLSPDSLNQLQAMGHRDLTVTPWGIWDSSIGDANSVMQRDGEIMGMSDPRNAGGAVGVRTAPEPASEDTEAKGKK
ncbi:MAG: gamma-glutamyltransferase [Pseudomonadota bacterium]